MGTVEYLPPDVVPLSSAADRLAQHLSLHDGVVGYSDRTYFDTFDGLLHGAGLVAVHDRGRLSVVERASGREVAGASLALPTGPVLALEMTPGPLRDALLPVVGVRALLPLVRVHVRERRLDVRDDERKTVVRMAVEEPELITRTGRPVSLRPRLRLSPVRGYDDELASVRGVLERDVGFRAADQPLVDEAVRAAGGTPGGIAAKVSVPLAPTLRSDAAAVAVLHRLQEVIEANFDGTLADIDAEFLHDLRVSVRRSRSVQRELKTVFAPEPLAHFRAEFRWLQQITGEARDLDVYVLDFGVMCAFVPEAVRTDLAPLLDVLRRHREAAHVEMARTLRSSRSRRALRDWAAFLEELVEQPLIDRPGATRPIDELAAERIRKVYRQMVRMGRAIGPESPATDYHELRKKGKELRYLLELFGAPLFPSDVVKPMVKALKSVQDVLGRHQDREVQVARLRAMRDEVAADPGGPAALMAMGILVEHLGRDERRARSEFAETFAAFASKAQRRLVDETFTADA